MVESDDVAPGNVLGIMQKGYTLNGRTIRAAMVTVAKAKSVISVFVIIHGPACECRAVFVTPPHSRAAVSQEKLLPA